MDYQTSNAMTNLKDDLVIATHKELALEQKCSVAQALALLSLVNDLDTIKRYTGLLVDEIERMRCAIEDSK